MSGALYVTATKDNVMQVIDPVLFSVVAAIPMPAPLGITENPGLGRMYVGNRGINSISIEPDDLWSAAAIEQRDASEELEVGTASRLQSFRLTSILTGGILALSDCR